MLEKILALVNQHDELMHKCFDIANEKQTQINAHKRSYARRPEWAKLVAIEEKYHQEKMVVNKQIWNLCKEYREQVAPIPREYMEDIIKKANATENRGAWLLARAIFQSRENLVDTIEINEILWEDQTEGFLQFAKEIGIKKLAVTDTSTALNATLFSLINDGWKVEGTYTSQPYQFDKRIEMYCNTNISQRKGLLLVRE